MTRWLIRLSLLLLAVLSFPGNAPAQGLRDTPAADYAAIPGYSPEVVQVRRRLANGTEVMETRIIPLAPLPAQYDLGAYLPTPQNQEWQDCVGWAVARGAVSYQYGRSRWQKPAAEYGLFSPRFIYSQINMGSDKGSYIYNSSLPNAVGVLRDRGCATEATCPYDRTFPGGWNNQPTSVAAGEAIHFSGVQHAVIHDLEGIKRAVTQHTPVVLAVKTDNRLYDGTDTAIYRWSGAIVGRHAICAVGYDDNKQAVRIMNSWGGSWKDNGFCWVHYDQFAAIGGDANWCHEAHLIRVLDENPPRAEGTATRTFVLEADGSVTENGTAVLGAPAGFAHAMTATADWLYVVRPNGKVFTLAKSGTADLWDDISSGTAPQGLGGQQVAMLAGRPDFLFVLTRSDRVYARIPGVNDSRVWQQLPLSGGEIPIDLRVQGGQIFVATASGKIFRRDLGVWTHLP